MLYTVFRVYIRVNGLLCILYTLYILLNERFTIYIVYIYPVKQLAIRPLLIAFLVVVQERQLVLHAVWPADVISVGAD